MSSPASSSIASLDDALQAYVREAGFGTHPTPSEMEALRAGDLPSGQAECIEQHLAACSECSEMMRDLADFLDDEVEAPSETEMMRAWKRHRKASTVVGLRRSTLLGVAFTMAATFFFMGLGLGFWGAADERTLPTSGPVRRVVIPSSTTRGPEDHVVINTEHDQEVVLQLQPRTLEGPDIRTYRVVFFAASGLQLFDITGSRGQDPDVFLRPDWRLLPQGSYRIQLLAVGEEERFWDEFKLEIDSVED